MAEAGLHRMAAPAATGGSEADPATQLQAIEAISTADGSAGWTLMIGAETGGVASATLAPEVVEEIYANPAAVMCGALNPLGRATPVAGGLVVSGQWPFASGCQRSDYFWGQCIVYDGDEPARESDGRVVLREVVVPKSHFKVVDTWHVSGLRGSGSHDVRVTEVFVPEPYTTSVTTERLRADGALFRMPLYSRLAYNKVGVSTGIARAAIDHFVALASAKVPRTSRGLLRERSLAQTAVAEAEIQLRSARAFVLESLSEVWESTLRGEPVSLEQRALLQLACSHAVRACARAVEQVCEAAGSSANFTASPLERCFRDAHVVPQHIMVAPTWIESAGRVLLGLESGSPIL